MSLSEQNSDVHPSCTKPHWGTQGGGIAHWDDERQHYVWCVLPGWYAECPEITEQVGDPIPEEWDLIPADESARNLMLEQDEEDFFPSDSYRSGPMLDA